MFINLENPLKERKNIVLGHIIQVLLQYKVGATPELGLKFREVSAADGVHPVIRVSEYTLYNKGFDPFFDILTVLVKVHVNIPLNKKKI